MVIAVRSQDAWEEAELRAINRKAGTTVVWIGADGADETVSVETARGPALAKALKASGSAWNASLGRT